jgi:hypothetical protein
MMTPTQALVDDYLRRLAAATADLPPDVREDLVTDVRSHLEEVQRTAGSEADLRTAIDRLGPPEAIAAEARGADVPAGTGADAGGAASGWVAPPLPRASSAGRDVTTVLTVLFAPLVLTFVLGFVGTFVGWLVGLGLLWTSRSWTSGEKALGTLVWPGGFVAPAFLALLGGRVCTSVSEVTVVEEAADGTLNTFVETGTALTEQCTGFALPLWAGIPVMLLTVAAPLVVAWVLLRRADGRRAGTRAAAS